MATLSGDDSAKLDELISKSHKEQAIWSELGEEAAEQFFKFVAKMNELDLQNGESGNAVDEMSAHRFLEHFNETMTVREMRDELRASGAITARPKSVPITHLLITKYKKSWHTLVNASQGDNAEEMARAQEMLAEVQAAYRECSARDEELATAQAELEASLAELKAQEDAYHAKIETLKKKSEEGGVVSRNKAKNELAQVMAEDPLPLRRAKLNTEAAKRRTDKAKEASAAALADAQQKLKEAEAYLEEVKARGGSAEGGLWWIERELHEARKYKPMAKGGIARN